MRQREGGEGAAFSGSITEWMLRRLLAVGSGVHSIREESFRAGGWGKRFDLWYIRVVEYSDAKTVSGIR
jgi:hypothetical protein